METKRNSSNIRIIQPLGTKFVQLCKGLTTVQRFLRHVDFLKDESLGLNIRRCHRYKALLLLKKLSLQEEETTDQVLFELNLSREDLKIIKK